MARTISFVSLGCAKNQVNTEQMLYLLREAGYDVTPEPDGSDLCLVNTCGFIDSAASEAIDRILELAQLKAAGRLGKILVAGCLTQRYGRQILAELPEVDGLVGCGSFFEIVPAVQAMLDGRQEVRLGDIDAPIPEVPRILTTPPWFAYLKIAEGCDNRCSYCVIPSLRGRYRSRPMPELLQEARELAQAGVKELIVVAQDTSRYGLDLYGERRLAQLLGELAKIDGLRWIRLHYLYPDEIPDELIDVIAREEKILKYLDIPIQHVNDGILRAMNRRGDRAFLEDLFARLRARIPGLVVRTSLITGLPGEGEDEFAELCGFLRAQKLERVGCFAFSPQEGTPAAQMPHPDESVAVQRAEHVSELQSRIMDEFNASRFGRLETVLCEGYDEGSGRFFGRSYAESPEIDGNIWFTAPAPVAPGSFVPVRILGEQDGELTGEMQDDNGK